MIIDIPDVDGEVEVRLEWGGQPQVVGLHPHLVDLLALPVEGPRQADLASQRVHQEGQVVAEGVLTDPVPGDTMVVMEILGLSKEEVPHSPVVAHISVHSSHLDNIRPNLGIFQDPDCEVLGWTHKPRRMVVEILH